MMRKWLMPAALALPALLAGCANPGGKLQQAGGASVFDLQLDSQLDWARIPSGARQELWTIDGPALNQLRIFSGVKPDEHVFLTGKKKDSRPDGPWFRAGMRPDEIRDVILDGLRGQNWSDVVAQNLRPASFGAVPGLRFDLTLVSESGLLYRGSAAAADRNGSLTALIWIAPAEHYYPRDAAAVTAMLDGLRFVAAAR